jgi:hypothetical protein
MSDEFPIDICTVEKGFPQFVQNVASFAFVKPQLEHWKDILFLLKYVD